MADEKTRYEVNMGIVVYKPNKELATLRAPVVVPSEWLENWRSYPTVSPNADAGEIVGSIAKEMMTDRYRNDKEVAADLLKWAATYPFVCEHGETIKNLPVWPADLTLVIRNITLIPNDQVGCDSTIITQSLESYLADQRGRVQVTMLDFDDDGNATDLTTLEMDADGDNKTVLDGLHRNRIKKWLH
jgi:hypothetical protein